MIDDNILIIVSIDINTVLKFDEFFDVNFKQA